MLLQNFRFFKLSVANIFDFGWLSAQEKQTLIKEKKKAQLKDDLPDRWKPGLSTEMAMYTHVTAQA